MNRDVMQLSEIYYVSPLRSMLRHPPYHNSFTRIDTDREEIIIQLVSTVRFFFKLSEKCQQKKVKKLTKKFNKDFSALARSHGLK